MLSEVALRVVFCYWSIQVLARWPWPENKKCAWALLVWVQLEAHQRMEYCEGRIMSSLCLSTCKHGFCYTNVLYIRWSLTPLYICKCLILSELLRRQIHMHWMNEPELITKFKQAIIFHHCCNLHHQHFLLLLCSCSSI